MKCAEIHMWSFKLGVQVGGDLDQQLTAQGGGKSGLVSFLFMALIPQVVQNNSQKYLLESESYFTNMNCPQAIKRCTKMFKEPQIFGNNLARLFEGVHR